MPTALELTREQWQPYIEATRQRPAPPELTPAEQQQREQLLVRVRQVATELKSRFRAKRVILFGSLAHADWFVPSSDVDLAVEPIVGTLVHDLYSFQELFARFDHPRLGITMDPSHLLLHRNDIPYAIERLGNKIRHVHMKDAVGRPGEIGIDFMFPSLGAGGVDWKGFFRALDRIGYTGAVCGEYEQFKYMSHVRGNDPRYAAKITYEEMEALYDHAYLSQ